MTRGTSAGEIASTVTQSGRCSVGISDSIGNTPSCVAFNERNQAKAVKVSAVSVISLGLVNGVTETG